MMGGKIVQWDVSKTILVIGIMSIIWQTNVFAESFDSIKDEFSRHIIDVAFPAEGKDTLRPIADSTVEMNVTLDWNLVSINDFDETNGYMEVSGFVTLEWVGDIYTTTLDVVDLIRPNLLWKPPVVLLNSVKTYEIIGHDTSVKVRYNFSTKECQWKPLVIARAACSPDVKYYPFDKQSCAFRLSVWGYNSTEISLTSKTNTWGFLYFEENGEWEINDTTVETSVINGFSVIDFKIKLTRRPLYYIINLISPVLLLGALSACTFLLPAESGERIGFSVTCFLSYVVLLNIIMGFLPSSGLPISYLSYYTFVMMIFSAMMSVMAIVTLRICHKSEEDHVPHFLEYTYRCFKCLCCKNSETLKEHKVKDKVVPLKTAPVSLSHEISTLSYDTLSETSVNTETEKVTWKNVASFIDTLFFLGFLGGQIFFSVAYLVPIFLN